MVAIKPAMTFEEIGAEMGVSPHSAQYIFNKAMRKLRRNSRFRYEAGKLLADVDRSRSFRVEASRA